MNSTPVTPNPALESLNSFYYIVFQAYPTRDNVYFWVDGGKTKHTLKRDVFLAAIDKSSTLKHDLYEAVSTTSYYLYDNVDHTIVRLTPSYTFSEYQYPLGKVFQAAKGGKTYEYEKGKRQKRTLEDELNELGFEPPDAEKTKNLQVALIKIKK